jgi:hypothetical protein
MAAIEAGKRTDATWRTELVGMGRRFGNGDYIFLAGNDKSPQGDDKLAGNIDGIRGLGNFKGNGIVGWGGDQGGNGVFGGGGQGRSGVPGGNGVVGFGTSAGGGDGVGVFGVSGGRAAGVVGSTAADGGQAGVLGFNSSTTGTAFGVFGRCDSNGGAGIAGRNSDRDGEGVSGFADVGTGVAGRSGGSFGTGVFGAGSGAGVLGVSTGARGVAGMFLGDVSVFGTLTLMGAVNKSVAVSVGKGSYRRLYSMESPESWFEDFGEGSLQRGRAIVRLPADFAPLVHTKGYHVFLTPYGDCGGLFVSNRTRTQFEVRELNGGKSSIRFSYRIVAKRKDILGKRLEKVQLPELPERARAEIGPVPTGRNDPLRALRVPDRPRRGRESLRKARGR